LEIPDVCPKIAPMFLGWSQFDDPEKYIDPSLGLPGKTFGMKVYSVTFLNALEA